MLLLQLLLVLLASETHKNAGIVSCALRRDGCCFVRVAITSEERLLCELVEIGPLSLITLNLTLVLSHDVTINTSDNFAFVRSESFDIANIFSSFIL